MKIAIYARVSSESRATEGTIDSQIKALCNYAKSHKLTIVQEFIDDQPLTAPAVMPLTI
jgi:DNA invertase Pin-like site-specific DNA recombinase